MGNTIFQELRRLLHTPKLYFTAMLLFSCIYTGFGGLNSYLMQQGQTVQAGELFIFGMDGWISLLIVTAGFLLLVNDVPFGKGGAQLRLIRSSRSRWLLGQVLSCFAITAVYLLLVALLFALATVRNLSFANAWSQPVVLAARLGRCTAIGIDAAVNFPMSVLQSCSAWVAFGVSFLYAWLLYGFFCLILIVCSLRFRTSLGYLIVMFCLILKRLLEVASVPSILKYLSPCDVASISSRPLTATNVLYAVLFFLLADGTLWFLARNRMEQVDL